jgi:valyl-tRNA synthetase
MGPRLYEKVVKVNYAVVTENIACTLFWHNSDVYMLLHAIIPTIFEKLWKNLTGRILRERIARPSFSVCYCSCNNEFNGQHIETIFQIMSSLVFEHLARFQNSIPKMLKSLHQIKIYHTILGVKPQEPLIR